MSKEIMDRLDRLEKKVNSGNMLVELVKYLVENNIIINQDGYNSSCCFSLSKGVENRDKNE